MGVATAYGLKWSSPIPIPAWSWDATDVGLSDVSVVVGQLPDPPADASATSVTGWCDAGTAGWRFPGVGRLRVAADDLIELDPDDDLDEVLAGLLLGSVAAAEVLGRRGWFPVRGSAVLGPKGALLITGPPAVGASTLAATLVNRGMTLVADNVVPLRIDDDGNGWILSGAPAMQLPLDGCRRLGISRDVRQVVRPNLPRRIVPYPDVTSGEHPLDVVVMLSSRRTLAIPESSLPGVIQVTEQLQRRCWDWAARNRRGVTPLDFVRIIKMLRGTRRIQVTRPDPPGIRITAVAQFTERVVA